MERMISQNRVEVIPSDFIMKCVKSNLFVIKGLRKRCGMSQPMSRRDCAITPNAHAEAQAVVGEEIGRSKQCAHFASTSELSDDPIRCAGVSRNARCACTL